MPIPVYVNIINIIIYSFKGITTGVSKENKEIDLKLAVFTATHAAIRSMDHMGELLKSFSKRSCLENLHMHRTKCTKLILNVISPSIVEQLVSNVGIKRYSLIVAESTDISVSKYIAYCIRYYSENLNCITTEFLGLAIVERAT